MEYTKEQLKAAYALNLCTVSVSQIIAYNDAQIMEQEYEAILNNLNLEQMPKDEALLKILKQLLDTITFFRVQEGDKQFIEKEYQQKMKNAVWAAVPNIGMIVAGGNPVTMAISLASQIGIGYMNYRKSKAESLLDTNKQKWQLERTAIEQFNGLQRELFDTAWRLAATYNFPDKLRLTERQIRQYNAILMDDDLLRKYERMDAIKDHFIAYPPFWYHFGNTANSIANCEDLALWDSTRVEYRNRAISHFQQFRSSNDKGLLREDQIAASCALELIDLLPIETNQDTIRSLLEEAIDYSGRANDVLQLSSIAYLKLNEQKKAAVLLRQLVNEGYNTILNAQLLSSLYVSDALHHNSQNARDAYSILQSRVGKQYLYPMPMLDEVDQHQLEQQFIKSQREILNQKYRLAFSKFIESYLARFGKIVPTKNLGDAALEYPISYYLEDERALQQRKDDIKEIFSKTRYAEEYKHVLKDVGVSFKIIALLNDLFNAVCHLNLSNESVQDILAKDIENGIRMNRNRLNNLQDKIDNGHISYDDVSALLDIHLSDFTKQFFEDLFKELQKYINSREEMQDFAIAEQNLNEFCMRENIPSPDILFGKEGYSDFRTNEKPPLRFGLSLLQDNATREGTFIDVSPQMESIIRQTIPIVIRNSERVEFFTGENAKVERYFNSNPKLRDDTRLKALTLAILDDKSQKGGYDLIFTSRAITPVINGLVKPPVAYKDIKFSKGAAIYIGGNFYSPFLNMIELAALIQRLAEIAPPLPEQPLFAGKGGFGWKH